MHDKVTSKNHATRKTLHEKKKKRTQKHIIHAAICTHHKNN